MKQPLGPFSRTAHSVTLGVAGRCSRRLRLRRDTGATAVEYGLLVALIAAAIVTAVRLFGGAVSNLFQTVLPFP